MATLADFLPEIFLEIMEVPDVVAEFHLRNTLIDFCQRSTYWREQVTFNTVADQSTYTDADFTLPADSRLVEVYDGKVGTTNIILRKTPTQLQSEVGFDWADQTGTVDYVTREHPDSLRLVRTPTSVQSVTLDISVKPTQTATTVDDRLYDDWHEVIAAGTLARLYAMNGKPWTETQAAGMKAGAFEAGVTAARRRAENAYLQPTRVIQYGGI